MVNLFHNIHILSFVLVPLKIINKVTNCSKGYFWKGSVSQANFWHTAVCVIAVMSARAPAAMSFSHI